MNDNTLRNLGGGVHITGINFLEQAKVPGGGTNFQVEITQRVIYCREPDRSWKLITPPAVLSDAVTSQALEGALFNWFMW